MANTIQIKRSSTASDTPSASDLAVGELAVNTADAKLFTKHSDGTIKELAGGGGGGSGDITAVTAGTGLTGGGTSGAVTVNVDTGIANGKIPVFTSGAADDDFLKIDGTSIEGRSASEVLSDIAAMPLAGGTFTGNVTLESTDDGATDGPTLTLYRNSPSPATSDELGEIKFLGRNDNSQDVIYGRIHTTILDASDGTEDGRVEFRGRAAGSEILYLQMKSGSSQFFRDVQIGTSRVLKFEGATADDFETTLTVTDPTADRTITLPDTTGTVLTTGNSDTPTTTTSSSDADFVLVDDGGTMKKITPSNLGVGGVTPATAYFDAYLNSDVTIGSGSATIAYDTTRQNVGSAFSLSSGELTISVAGTYMVMYQVTMGQSGSSNRTEGKTELQKQPSGGAFSSVDGTDAKYYSRSSGQDETTASMSAILTVSANDVFRVVGSKVNGSGLLIARADGSRITVFRIA